MKLVRKLTFHESICLNLFLTIEFMNTKLFLLTLFLQFLSCIGFGQVPQTKSLSNQSLYIFEDFEGRIGGSPYEQELRDSAGRVDSLLGMKVIYDFLYYPRASSSVELEEYAEELRAIRLSQITSSLGSTVSIAFSFPSGEDPQNAQIIDLIEWPGEGEISPEQKALIKLKARSRAEQFLEVNPIEFTGAAVEYLKVLLETQTNPSGCICHLGKKYLETDTLFIPQGRYSVNLAVMPREYPSDSCRLRKFNESTTINLFSKKSFKQQDENTLTPQKSPSPTIEGGLIEATYTDVGQELAGLIRCVVVDVRFKTKLAKRDNKLRLTADWNKLTGYHSDPNVSPSLFPNLLPNKDTYYQYMSNSYGVPYKIEVEVKPVGVPSAKIRVVPDNRSSAAMTQVSYHEGRDSLSIPFNPVENVNPPWFSDTLQVGDVGCRIIRRYSQREQVIPLNFISITTAVERPNGAISYNSPTKIPNRAAAQAIVDDVNNVYKRIGVRFDLRFYLVDTVRNATKDIIYTLGSETVPDDKSALSGVVFSSIQIQETLNSGFVAVVIVPGLKNTETASGSSVGGISYSREFVSFLPDKTPPRGNQVKDFGHEIGHSVFGLRHPFRQFTAFNQGDDEYNIMDYDKADSGDSYSNSQLYFRPYQFVSIRTVIVDPYDPGVFN